MFFKLADSSREKGIALKNWIDMGWNLFEAKRNVFLHVCYTIIDVYKYLYRGLRMN